MPDRTTRSVLRPLRVLESVAAPGDSVKYIDQVVRYAPTTTRFLYFSWSSALLRRYDVFHIHWPEGLLRGGSRVPRPVKKVLLAALLLRCRLLRVPIVRTVHNLRPHSAGPAGEEKWLARIDAGTALAVHLNTCTPHTIGKETVVVPHGHYREQFSDSGSRQPVPGRYLSVGRIQPYKRVPAMMDVFQRDALAGESLRIVGSPTQSLRTEIDERLRDWTRSDAPASAELEFVSDSRMVQEILDAECVLLPYEEMHNSGIALVALSLDRPVVVPRSCVNEALAEEVGDGWVVMFDGPFSASSLAAARAALAEPRSARPDLGGREWARVATSYASAFERAREVSR